MHKNKYNRDRETETYQESGFVRYKKEQCMKREFAFYRRTFLGLVFPISQVMLFIGNQQALRQFGFLGYLGIGVGVMADFTLLWILLHDGKRERLEQELKEARHMQEVKAEYNRIFEERQEELLALKKEFSSQLDQVCSSLESGAPERAGAVLGGLASRLEETRPEQYCQNMVVNAVLSEKQKKCHDLGFSMEAELVVPARISIEPLHLCSIFSNLVDNGIAANAALDRKLRMLSVKTELRGRYLFIKVINGAEEAYVNRRPEEGHGYGKQILRDIAGKYEGKYETSFEDGIFTAVMMLKTEDGDI